MNKEKYVADDFYSCRLRLYKDYAPTLRSERTGLKVVEIPTGVAMRGRYDDEGKIKQNIECHFDGIANSITTVGKDSMVLEVKDEC